MDVSYRGRTIQAVYRKFVFCWAGRMGIHAPILPPPIVMDDKK
ncbi:MAG: hypothetical protein QHH14_13755 [Clostridiales bacterium]|nr:hypothetical protein [Clostridiales bacterium]